MIVAWKIESYALIFIFINPKQDIIDHIQTIPKTQAAPSKVSVANASRTNTHTLTHFSIFRRAKNIGNQNFIRCCTI